MHVRRVVIWRSRRVGFRRFYCIFALRQVGRRAPGLAATFFEPSMANSCWSSCARGGGDVGSLTPRCSEPQQPQPTTTNWFCVSFFLSRLSVEPMWSVPSAEHAAGTAKRRRERRLRQFLRHERLTVAMLLAETNHAAPRGRSGGVGTR